MPSAEPKTTTVTRGQARYRSWVSDVLVYTLVLNLFDEYWDAIVIESFTVSVLTAVLMKVLLDALALVEHHVHGFVGARNKVLGVISMWLVLFLSKFVILETVELVFGDEVELGQFLDVVVLIITMMAARELNARAYDALGQPDEEEVEAAS